MDTKGVQHLRVFNISKFFFRGFSKCLQSESKLCGCCPTRLVCTPFCISLSLSRSLALSLAFFNKIGYISYQDSGEVRAVLRDANKSPSCSSCSSCSCFCSCFSCSSPPLLLLLLLLLLVHLLLPPAAPAPELLVLYYIAS